MKITILSVSVPALQQVLRYKKEYAAGAHKDYPEFEVFYIAGLDRRYLDHPEILIDAIRQADIAVVDTMGAPEAFQEIVRQGLEQCQGQRIVIGNTLREYIRLGSFSMDAMKKMGKSEKKVLRKPEPEKKTKSVLDRMHRMRRMAFMVGNVLPFGITKDMKNVFLLMDYWQQASPSDIDSFLNLLLRQYGKYKDVPKEKPCTMKYGIYLKDPFTLECFDTLGQYKKTHDFHKGKDILALLFYGHSYPNDFLPVVREVYETLSIKYDLLPVAFSQNEDQDLETLAGFFDGCGPRLAGIINLMPFRLGAGPMGGNADRAVEILKEKNVPYFKPFCLTKVKEGEWKDAEAVNPGEFLISILLPELDGGILTFPIGILGDSEEEEGRELQLSELHPIEERVQMLCRRIDRMLALRRKKNKEKRAAFLFYNYPPGENNLFGGAFLDTFASAAYLLKVLKEAGYDTEETDADKLRQIFTEEGRCNAPQWGEESESLYTYTMEGKEYPVRGICIGNIFLGLQPVREGDDSVEAYHDRNQEPPKAYQAFYRWVHEIFQADVMIHFGTHGTLEFMQGKDNGMMGSCWPDKLIDATPHVYYYYMGNPSEAMIAKRRSHGVLVSYKAPPLKKGGLYGPYEEMKEIIREYRESMQTAPERCGDLLKNIEKLAVETELAESVTENSLHELEDRLYEYENSLITDGLHKLDEEEAAGLLRAMNGEYLPVGPGGDVIKNPEVLPGGRNLVQFDPRLVPTRTAYERGAAVAKETMERYLQETGRYPDTTAVILWGLETSRSQGETLGQILYYLGIRLKTDKSSFDDRLEIIPMEELNRPRIDVCIHICGFFRDMYPNLVNDLNEMLQQLLHLGESGEMNYFLKNTQQLLQELLAEGMEEEQAAELASCRIFGPKKGEYGTRLTDTVRTGNWKDPSELGNSFVEDLSYAYTFKEKGKKAEELVKKAYTQVDFISQVRNNVEYELTDLDHYYEFYGGLAKAVENSKGGKPVMYVADTTGEEVKVQDLKESLDRGIATRLLNPEWIRGMMKHEYHGVQQIAKRFENVMGFAASTDQITSETFSKMTRCYVENEELKQLMQKSNKWAYMKMLERLMEAKNRGYYQATEEELSRIQEAYLETEGDAEQ